MVNSKYLKQTLTQNQQPIDHLRGSLENEKNFRNGLLQYFGSIYFALVNIEELPHIGEICLLLKLDALSDMGKLESVKLWEQYTNEIIGEEVKLIDAGTIVQKNFHNCSYYISK